MAKKSKKLVSTATDNVARVKGTVVPIAFKDFIDRMAKYSNVVHKASITTFSNDDGIFVSCPKLGSTEGKIALFMNKSRGWKPESKGSYREITIDEHYTGDLRVTVIDTQKSIKEAVKFCREWMVAKPGHKPLPVKSKAETPKKEKKAGRGRPKKDAVEAAPKKIKKKHKKAEMEAAVEAAPKKIKIKKKHKKMKGNSVPETEHTQAGAEA